MFTIKFNKVIISSVDTEDKALGLALNLHKSSNVEHNILVTKDDDVVILRLFGYVTKEVSK